MAENYQLRLDAELAQITAAGRVPRLLLHSCCAPCSSYVLEYLSRYFRITVLYYNPNISPREEFERRAAEQRRLLAEMPLANPADFRQGRSASPPLPPAMSRSGRAAHAAWPATACGWRRRQRRLWQAAMTISPLLCPSAR